MYAKRKKSTRILARVLSDCRKFSVRGETPNVEFLNRAVDLGVLEVGSKRGIQEKQESGGSGCHTSPWYRGTGPSVPGGQGRRWHQEEHHAIVKEA